MKYRVVIKGDIWSKLVVQRKQWFGWKDVSGGFYFQGASGFREQLKEAEKLAKALEEKIK